MWTHVFILVNLSAWGILFISMMVFHRAQPEFETLFDRFFRLDLRTVWDIRFLNYLIYTIFLGLAISILGLVLGMFRARRKTDRKRHLLILGAIYLFLLGVSFCFL